MSEELKILLDRIKRFGNSVEIDEYGSYNEWETQKLWLALSDEEFEILKQAEIAAEVAQRDKAASAA
jgi:hypothetical protein